MTRGTMDTTLACGSCNRSIEDGQKMCQCGKPTRFMGFKERTQYELEQYRAAKERQTA